MRSLVTMLLASDLRPLRKTGAVALHNIVSPDFSKKPRIDRIRRKRGHIHEPVPPVKIAAKSD